MKCPFCQGPTRVYNSRSSHQASQTWRRRQCGSCHKAFTTREKADLNGLVAVRSSDTDASYSSERLLLSVARASYNLDIAPEMICELAGSIEDALREQRFFDADVQDAGLITEVATTVLQRFNTNVALQYINLVYANNPPAKLVQQLFS